MNPPFVGAGVSATTLVVAFGFAVSRPCLTLKVRTFLELKTRRMSCSLSDIWFH
jgi:hypothetical protein